MKPKKLSVYIEEFRNDARAGEALGLSERTAAAYRRGERSPKRKDMPALIERSGGVLTFGSFYPDFGDGIVDTNHS